jgi:hypothetical protein
MRVMPARRMPQVRKQTALEKQKVKAAVMS